MSDLNIQGKKKSKDGQTGKKKKERRKEG